MQRAAQRGEPPAWQGSGGEWSKGWRRNGGEENCRLMLNHDFTKPYLGARAPRNARRREQSDNPNHTLERHRQGRSARSYATHTSFTDVRRWARRSNPGPRSAEMPCPSCGERVGQSGRSGHPGAEEAESQRIDEWASMLQRDFEPTWFRNTGSTARFLFARTLRPHRPPHLGCPLRWTRRRSTRTDETSAAKAVVKPSSESRARYESRRVLTAKVVRCCKFV